MWSIKKDIDDTIIILLFLTAINFLHLGQLILPLICIYVFISSGYKFKVNNKVTFILLCSFGLTFFIFSYKLGFYSIMGFCFPMAYYIGSNIQKTDERSIKRVIYLIAFSMALHICLNFVVDVVIDGADFFNSINHYDAWMKEYVPTTATAVNGVMLISLSYYLLIFEKEKKYQLTGFILLLIILLYDIALGRRTPLFLLILCIIYSVIFNIKVIKNNKIRKDVLYGFIVLIMIIVLLITVSYVFDIFGSKEFIENLGIIKKFKDYGLDTGRLDIFIEAIKLAPQHLWGGKEISDIIGIQIHDLWMDTFDYAGIIPFVLLVVHTIIFISIFIKIMKNNSINKEYKLFISVLYLAITIQLLLEPIMTGSSLFIILVIMIEAMLEKQYSENGK